MTDIHEVKRHKIGTIDEFKNIYKNEWLLLEVMEMNELDEPTVGRILSHRDTREDIYADLRASNLKDVVLLFSGDIPERGTLLMF